MKELTFPDVPVLRGKRVTFLLGTDQHIGAGIDPDGNPKKAETRVGLLPEQVRTLREWLEKAGIALDFYFVHGAGIRSGIPDIAYMNEGGRMVFEHQLPTMPEPDLVHALKEPSSYESLIPGRFNRIGALHPGAISKESGVGLLLKKRNFAAIFDGGSIGTDRFIPIRGGYVRLCRANCSRVLS